MCSNAEGVILIDPRRNIHNLKFRSVDKGIEIETMNDADLQFGLENKLRKNIRNILKFLPDEEITEIIKTLKNVGVESLSDLKFVLKEDLCGKLKPVQIRKLIGAWTQVIEIETMNDTDIQSGLENKLRKNICNILKFLPDEITEIIKTLKAVGVESLSDLKFVLEEDLCGKLKPVQIRKLIGAWTQQSLEENVFANQQNYTSYPQSLSSVDPHPGVPGPPPQFSALKEIFFANQQIYTPYPQSSSSVDPHPGVPGPPPQFSTLEEHFFANQQNYTPYPQSSSSVDPHPGVPGPPPSLRDPEPFCDTQAKTGFTTAILQCSESKVRSLQVTVQNFSTKEKFSNNSFDKEKNLSALCHGKYKEITALLRRWKSRNYGPLLKIYSYHKLQITSFEKIKKSLHRQMKSSSNRKSIAKKLEILWEEIADEMKKKFSVNWSGEVCKNKVVSLKNCYEIMKRDCKKFGISPSSTCYVEMEKAFGSDDNFRESEITEVSIDQIPTTSTCTNYPVSSTSAHSHPMPFESGSKNYSSTVYDTEFKTGMLTSQKRKNDTQLVIRRKHGRNSEESFVFG